MPSESVGAACSSVLRKSMKGVSEEGPFGQSENGTSRSTAIAHVSTMPKSWRGSELGLGLGL